MLPLKKNTSRANLGLLGGWLSITLNVSLFLVKAIIGFLVGSVALIADAFHTLSDLGTSFIVLYTFHVSEKPSDAKHPFGHGRAEFISAIIIGTLLAVTAVELFKYSIERTFHPVAFKATWWIIIVILLTVLLKEALAFYTSFLAKKINSPALKADTLHHHQDAISSLLVVMAFILSMYGFPYLDGPLGILIALIILYSAYQIAKSPVDHLLGIAPDEELLEKIEKIALLNPEIQGIHDIIIHQYGEIKVISLHIEVDESLSLEHSHKIAEELDRILVKKLNTYTTVHVDPVMKRTQLYTRIESTIKNFCKKSAECASFHDLRIFREKDTFQISVDLVTDTKFSNPSVKKLQRECYLYLKEKIPDISHVSIKIEPKFSISRKSRHN